MYNVDKFFVRSAKLLKFNESKYKKTNKLVDFFEFYAKTDRKMQKYATLCKTMPRKMMRHLNIWIIMFNFAPPKTKI
jgi:hypothetical protein